MTELKNGWSFTGKHKDLNRAPDFNFPGISKENGDYFSITVMDTIGITVGHNGTIYFYTKPNSKVTDRDLKVALLKQKGYNFRERDEDALRYLAKQFDFEFKVL